MTILFILIAVLFIATISYISQDKFGKSPSGKRLAKIVQSPNYRDGKFQNLSETPTLAEGHNYIEVLYEAYFKTKPRHKPKQQIPSVKTNLLNLSLSDDVLIWFGHSSYFMQIDGKRILVDPVFSGNASPIPGTVKSFDGADIYTVQDLPTIDYLFITHDHYDHVDYETIKALKDKTKKVICGLGVGAHFEHWGYKEAQIIEGDWHDNLNLGGGFSVNYEPTRHFSGRGLSRNNTLWTAFMLTTPSMKIYLGGDSGYDKHYANTGQKHGAIDLAILDNGQYNKAWKYIHNAPQDVLQAAIDLKAKRVFPVHSSKFALASYDWDEPLSQITVLNQSFNIPLVTPKIGEPVYLKNTTQQFTKWWETLD